jgi:TPP-dependent trihydroxycyclohexane-1,2-dione (THcHDO) dehydratase
VPYALIPDGYNLKKVTRLQKDAVNAKRRHDNVEALLANPNTPLVLGGGALLAITPLLFAAFRTAAEESGIVLPDVGWKEVEENWKLALGPAGITQWLAEKVVGERRLQDFL